jgi:anti-sigma B factor antagonist
MAIEFSIDDRRLDDDTHVIAVAGEVDLFTAPEFKERVMAPIAADVERVVVDLSDASFIDSSSLGVLIGAHRRLRARGGRLMVACDDSAILKTFRVTGLDSVFTIAPTVEEALAAPDPDAEAA